MDSRHARKRVVWITDLNLDRHVHGTSRIEILRHLADRGYDVQLLAIRSRSFQRREQHNVDIRCVPLRYVPLVQASFFSFILFFFLPLYAVLKKPDFIITEPGPSILAFAWKPFLSFLGTRVILDVRSTPVEVRGRLASVQAFVFRVSIMIADRLFDGMTAITRLMKQEIARQFCMDLGSIGVWTDGVSTRLFDPTKYRNDRLQLRNENHLGSAFVVLYHGAMSPHRGIIESVESIGLLKGRHSDIVLFLLGSGPAVSQIRRIARERRLEDKVKLHDIVPYRDVPKYIAMSDVGIVPLPDQSDWRYQCPLKLLEYLAMEKPVVMTDIPCNREIVGDSRCGIYIPTASPKAIAEGIASAREHRTMLKEWGREGRVIVKEKYDWVKVAGQLDGYLTRCRRSGSWRNRQFRRTLGLV